MDFIPQYIRGKNDAGSITYDCPQLEPILAPTYGCIVYQEQVMQIAVSYTHLDVYKRQDPAVRGRKKAGESKISLLPAGDISKIKQQKETKEKYDRIFSQTFCERL